MRWRKSCQDKDMDSTLCKTNWKRNQYKDLTSNLETVFNSILCFNYVWKRFWLTKPKYYKHFIINQFVNRCDYNFIYLLETLCIMIVFQVSLNFNPVKEMLKIPFQIYILMKKVIFLRTIQGTIKTFTLSYSAISVWAWTEKKGG